MSEKDKCINSKCDEYNANEDNNCTLWIKGTAGSKCRYYIAAPRPEDSLGSTVATWLKCKNCGEDTEIVFGIIYVPGQDGKISAMFCKKCNRLQNVEIG